MANHYGAGWGTHQARRPGRRAEQAALRPVRHARPGRRHPQRAAAGRRRPRDPGPLGHRAPPRLDRPLRLAAVRDRAAARVLRRGARRGGRARHLADPADQGHEPGLPGQGRLLHRHQAGPAGGRGGGAGRRAAGHAGLAGRRAATRRSRWTRRGGSWCSARTTTRSPAPSPTRSTWTCSAAGGRRSSAATAARQDAAAHLAGLADTRPRRGRAGAAARRRVVVFNTLSWPRSGLATLTLEFAAPGPPWLALRDDAGRAVPFLAEGCAGTRTARWPR